MHFVGTPLVSTLSPERPRRVLSERVFGRFPAPTASPALRNPTESGASEGRGWGYNLGFVSIVLTTLLLLAYWLYAVRAELRRV
ncbi:MAG: hypothetical protein M3P44_15385 [Actinomycetota bacterium]|nr:hypothetical protein [Actinomycetota bacterium]